MTTFGALIDRCLVQLNDEAQATWDDTMIAEFINDAIRDYSNHFPRFIQYELSLSAGVQVYDLPADFIAMISVEYPDGEAPRVYLEQRPFDHQSFWVEEGYYAVIAHKDESDQSQIWFSDDDISAGQKAQIQYLGHHVVIADTSSISGNTTVPPAHQQLIVQFVAWRATEHLQFAEQQNPTSNSSLLMAQLAQNARRLELSYHTSLQQAAYSAEGDSKITFWLDSSHDYKRIY